MRVIRSHLKVQLYGKTDLSFKKIDFDASLSAEKGEVLWGRYYLDLSNHPMNMLSEGWYDAAGGNLHLSGSTLRLQKILNTRMSGDLFNGEGGPKVDIQVSIPATPVDPLFRFLVREPFRMEKPFLANLQLKGEISADLRLKSRPAGREVKGRFLWHDGLLSSPDQGIMIKDVDLSLPVWHQAGGREQPSGQMEGKLEMGTVKIPFLPEQPLKMQLVAGPDRIFVGAETTVKVPGGEVRVLPIQVQNIFSPNLSLDTGFSVNDLPLKSILEGIWPNPVNGSISGKLAPIHFEKGVLSSGGSLVADVFGGEIVLSHAGASGLFGPAPVFRMDARWSDLQLLQLTEGTPFGEIEGVLNGHADHVEVSDGQLQRFDLLLETTKKKGVPQKISVKAVDNIAQLGGSGSPFVGVAGVFMMFFKQFPYEKIGIHASLENDVFKINGTIHDGGKEFLIKRGFLSGVDVINQNPDNRVSFKDMLSRIKRISASKGGPVIR